MKKLVYGSLATLAAVAAGLSIVAARRLPTIRANTYVGPVAVGGMTKEDAARQIRTWWESQKLKKLEFHLPNTSKSLQPRTPGSLGIVIDDQATVAALPISDLASDVEGIAHVGGEKMSVLPVFKSVSFDLGPFGAEVRKLEPPAQPASAVLQDGQIVKTRESGSESIDRAKLLPAVAKAITQNEPVEVPLTSAIKRVPDSELDKITEVVSEFSTHFPASNRPRCSNIKLASSKLRGIVLLPGERMSFNGTVGRRTLRAGFQVAGVYKNGKHDVGIGGGICQVSTTLYNASLFADLKIKQRSNHSLPVAYVPLGRDATVDYGSLDLVIENSYTTPIAIDSHYTPGKLTFRVLGKKDPSLTVKIQQSEVESWDPDISTVVDHRLRPGSRRVIEPGHVGHAVSTFRLVYKDGTLVRRERLGRCTYGGQTRIVAFNPAAPRPKVMPSLVPAPPGVPAQPPTSLGGL